MLKMEIRSCNVDFSMSPVQAITQSMADHIERVHQSLRFGSVVPYTIHCSSSELHLELFAVPPSEQHCCYVQVTTSWRKL